MIPKHDVTAFSWAMQDNLKTGVAEASDFKGKELVAQAFDDACDVGFELVDGTKTVAMMLMTRAQEDCWTFRSQWVSSGSSSDLRIVIFND
jgi:hypothetical protein